MSRVAVEDKDAFFADVAKASDESIWCALATVSNNEARVRIVHPSWEGDVLWIATGPETLKVKEMEQNASVDVQFQVSPPGFIHILCRGRADLCMDDATRKHAWDAMNYDLTQFFPGGATGDDFIAIRINPTRVELSEMFGTANKRVWRPS